MPRLESHGLPEIRKRDEQLLARLACDTDIELQWIFSD
jgi:hypothetical protein